MTVAAVPSLSTDGWVTDIRKKADLVMAHYFASDYSQSNVFLSKITSLAYQVQREGHNTFELKRLIESDLQQYLGRYFDNVQIDVRIEDEDASGTNRYNIVFDATVAEHGIRYSLGRLIEVQNSKIKRIVKLLQTGVDNG